MKDWRRRVLPPHPVLLTYKELPYSYPIGPIIADLAQLKINPAHFAKIYLVKFLKCSRVSRSIASIRIFENGIDSIL